VDLPDSLAGLPRRSDDGARLTVTLRSNRWSNGEAVDADDVLFWMKLLHVGKRNVASGPR